MDGLMMKDKTRFYALLALALALVAAGALGMYLNQSKVIISAEPSTFADNMTDAVNDALFGGTNSAAAGTLISGVIFFMLILPMAALRVKPMVVFLVLLIAAGVLTAMNLLPTMILVVVAILLALMFSRPIAQMFSGGGM